MNSFKKVIFPLLLLLLLFGCDQSKPETSIEPQGEINRVKDSRQTPQNLTEPSAAGDVPLSETKEDTGSPEPEVNTATNTEQSNHPPEINSVAFETPYIYKGVDVTLIPDVSDADGDSIALSYSWNINGNELPEEQSATLPGNLFAKGDKISFTVKAVDDTGAGQTYSGEFIIPNAPPQFDADIQNQLSGNSLDFYVKATDPDEDPLTFSLIDAPKGMSINPATGHIHWDKENNQQGSYKLQVIVADNDGGQGTMDLDIQPSNPPAASITQPQDRP